MNWKEIVGSVAPIAGGLLGGPLGAIAGTALSSILGIHPKSTPEDIAMAVSHATPEQLLKLKEYDTQLQLKLQDNIAIALTTEQDIANGANAINLADANSTDKFRSYWRPFIGWSCASIICIDAINQLICAWWFHHVPTYPLNNIITLITLLLGVAGLRTYEKKVGVS